MTDDVKLDARKPYEDLRAQLKQAAEENAALEFDYNDPVENKEARSHVYGLRRLKGDIDRKRKELKKEALEYGRAVDAAAKELTGWVEEMIDVHQKPLDEVEQAEKKRKEKHEENLALFDIPDTGHLGATQTPDEIQDAIDDIEEIEVDESWEEYEAQAAEKKLKALRGLKEAKAKSEERVAKEKELEELRRKEAEREAEAKKLREENERLKREAEEREQRKADEAAAQEETDKEPEQERVEQEAQETADEVGVGVKQESFGGAGATRYPSGTRTETQRRFGLQVNLQGAAFNDGVGELARLLRELADRLEAGEKPERVLDHNGNTCGEVICRW